MNTSNVTKHLIEHGENCGAERLHRVPNGFFDNRCSRHVCVLGLTICYRFHDNFNLFSKFLSTKKWEKRYQMKYSISTKSTAIVTGIVAEEYILVHILGSVRNAARLLLVALKKCIERSESSCCS